MTKPKPTTPDGELQPARRQLADAISALIDPRPQQAHGRTLWLDPRYHELREALTAQRIGAHSAPSSQPPAWLGAIDILKDIDLYCRQIEPGHLTNDCDEYPTIQRLRALDTRKWRPQDTTHITDIANRLTTHATDIDKLFAEPPKYLPNPCPRCNKHQTRRIMDDGQPGYTPALQVTTTGANCNHCKTHWPANELPFLGRLLGYRIEGVIG